MKNKRTIMIWTTSFFLTGLAAFGLFRFLPQQVRAFNPQPDPPGFGMIGITPGQTLRITVVNTANAPDSNFPPDPCRVVITFRDGNGNLFRTANGNPVRRVALLRGGQSTFLDLSADDFPGDTAGLRLQLHPDVRVQQATGDGNLPPDPCIPAGEVFNNNTGRTQFMVNTFSAVQRTTQPAAN